MSKHIFQKVQVFLVYLHFISIFQYESVDTLAEMLKNLQTTVGMSALSLKSQNFLSIPEHERESFLDTYKTTPLQRKNVVTCLSTLKKSYNEDDALSCLVIGTENSEILVLHPETFTPIDEVVKLNGNSNSLVLAKNVYASCIMHFPGKIDFIGHTRISIYGGSFRY